MSKALANTFMTQPFIYAIIATVLTTIVSFGYMKTLKNVNDMDVKKSTCKVAAVTLIVNLFLAWVVFAGSREPTMQEPFMPHHTSGTAGSA